MFEKEIEFIYKYNLNKIKQLGSFITYEQLLSTNIHPALLQYLSAEIDFLIYEDRQKLLKDSLFDYSGEKIIEHFTRIGEEIKRTKKFSYDYLSKLLLHASSFNVNFIVRPKWSLMQFIFENEKESTKQITEVKQILNYLYYYPYLKRLLINFFDKKRMIEISNNELKELLDKIDKINYESNFDKVLDSALTSMAEFIYMGEVQNKKVSKQLVELFLSDKGLSHFETALNENFSSNSSDRFDISEFKNTIMNYLADEDAVSNSNEDGTESEPDTVEESQEEYASESEVEEVFGDDDSSRELYETEEVDTSSMEHSEELIEEIEEDSLDEDGTDEITDSGINNSDSVENAELDEILEEEADNKKKSFLESHIDSLENTVEEETTSSVESSDELDENEPPDFDEATRIDEENVDEIYGLVTEETEIDVALDDDVSLPRMELGDDEENPFESDTNEDLLDTIEDTLDGKSEATEDIEGEWAITSSNDKEDSIETLKLPQDFQNITTELDSEKTEDETIDAVISKETEGEEDEEQQMLFDENELGADTDLVNDVKEESEESTENNPVEESVEQSIDISLLLENKKITKIIEVVFDYDMEEFASTIDKISECKSKEEAHIAIDEAARKAYVSPSVKEVKVFKSIISDYFK